MRRETFVGGWVEQTMHEQSNTPCTNMLDGKGRRHGQHNTWLGIKTRRKEGGVIEH